MIRNYTLTLLLTGFAFATQAQTVLFEENFNEGLPETWTTFNVDGLTPAADVAIFTNAWISYIAGVDTAVASTSFYEPDSSANDYLISPKISIGTFSKIVWDARSIDASFPDSYQVLISTTDSLVSSFTDTLFTILAESPYLTKRSVELDLEGYANQDIFIAFQNNSNNAYILLIDNFKVLGAETAGILNEEKLSSISLYPNPSNNFININTAQKLIGSTIYNSQGKLVFTSTLSKIDIRNLPAGLYFITISTENGQESLKFIKK